MWWALLYTASASVSAYLGGLLATKISRWYLRRDNG